MALPTRNNFFASGLVPVVNGPSDSCSICLNEPKDPAKLPCKHVFCKACISQWLNQPDTNTCAVCRKALFALDNVDAGGPLPPTNTGRSGQVARAFRASGLANSYSGPRPHNPDNAPFTQVETFSGEVPYSRSQLIRSGRDALATVLDGGVPRATGTVRIHAAAVGAEVVAISNMLRQMATQEGRPYGAARTTVWNDLSVMVGLALISHDGAETESADLQTCLMTSFQPSFEATNQMAGPRGDFITDPALRHDLEVLIGFVVQQARRATAEAAPVGMLPPFGASMFEAPRRAPHPTPRYTPPSTPRRGQFSQRAPHFGPRDTPPSSPRRGQSPDSPRRSNHVHTLIHGHADSRCVVM